MRALTTIRPFVVVVLLMAGVQLAGHDLAEATPNCGVGAMALLGPTPVYHIGLAASRAVNGDQPDRCESGALAGAADPR